MSYTLALIAAEWFHTLAIAATRTGGCWVSSGGGTANVVAGEIARATGVDFESAHRALDEMGGEGWYRDFARAQPHNNQPLDDGEVPGRWDALTIARAACRHVRGSE